MSFNVFAAVPSNEDWACISQALKSKLPKASILRVKDGVQAARFLFEEGLVTDDPQLPNLVVLAGNLEGISAEHLVSRLRDDARTHSTPVIMFWRGFGEDPVSSSDAVTARVGLLTVNPGSEPENDIVDAIYRTCSSSLLPLAEG